MRHCRSGLRVLLGLSLLSCPFPRGPQGVRWDSRSQTVRVHAAPSPSSAERYCAWYGDARGGVLYFGSAAFWSALRAHGGDPTADLLQPGPQLVGRFELGREDFLSPLPTGAASPRSGTWDVLAHPNGRVYFTTFFEAAGYVDPNHGGWRRFDAAGPGLNELAVLPDGRLLATRYAAQGRPNGSVVLLDEDGRVLAEHELQGPEGWRVAPKSVAFDPGRREIWVTTDLLPIAGGAPRHDSRVLDADTGRERRRIEQPEIQFVLFAPDGSGYLAELDGVLLALRLLPRKISTDPEPTGRRILLDSAFPAQADFVQDLQRAEDGRLVVTRWSGRVHIVEATDRVRTLDLPRTGSEGLYYTAVLADGRLCATYCSGVTVVCVPAP